MWNQSPLTVSGDLVFRNGLSPAIAIDVKTSAPVAVQTGTDGAKIPGISFDSWETRVLLTPRVTIANAPSEWFDLQRHWWKGTTDPGVAPAPFKARNAMPIESDWAFHALDPVPHGAPPPMSPNGPIRSVMIPRGHANI